MQNNVRKRGIQPYPAGVAASSAKSEFVLFLDDDIRLHRNTVGCLVASMRKFEPSMFLSNGFPFDLPPTGGSFANYLTMVGACTAVEIS
jgi:hypothetical protein